MPNINDALGALRDTYRAEPNPERRQQLQDQYDRAVDAGLTLTTKNIDAHTAEYDAAVNALGASVADLRKASADIAKVGEAMLKVAKAVDVIVAVAKKVAA